MCLCELHAKIFLKARHKKIPQETWDFTLLIATPFFIFFFCFAIFDGAKIETSHPLVPLHNAAPHGKSKRKLLNLSENF